MEEREESELDKAAREMLPGLIAGVGSGQHDFKELIKAGALWLLKQAERQARETPFEAYDVILGLKKLCGEHD